LNLEAISVLAELDRCGIAYQFVGDDQVRTRCPSHKDKTPSCTIGTATRLFKCHTATCAAEGDFVTYLGLLLKQTRQVIIADLSKRYDVGDDVKQVDAEAVERWHALVWTARPLLNELYARGLTDDDVRKYRIGFNGGRLQIPIFDESKRIVNVRSYLPGAPAHEKMRNRRGMGKMRLFPIEQLAYDTIVICGGECKAIVAARLLNPHSIGAICATGGEGNWHHEFTGRLAGKRVYVMMDVDSAGVEAAKVLAEALRGRVAWIGIVDLPLDRSKYPKGDVNDWVGKEHATSADLKDLIDRTGAYQAPEPIPELSTDDLIESPVGRATEAQYVGKRLRVKGVVTAVADAPYIVPERVRVRCDQKQPNCSACHVLHTSAAETGFETEIPSDSPALIEMVNSGRETQRGAIRSALRIPPCKSVSFVALTHRNIEEARISSQLDISAHVSDDRVLSVLSVSHGLEGNAAYLFQGRTYPHPKTQAAVMLVTEQVPAQDALSTFAPSPMDLEAMRRFQAPAETPEAVTAQLEKIYDDLSANVTRIFRRHDLHLIIDLAYHSPLTLTFDGRPIKGWTEVLVVGDTAQGKSETTTQLMRHYGLGERVDVKNASVAGLVGGLQQLGARWFVTWGKIPVHDRRLVILEELKGLPIEAISRLTDMRSSGIADIDKIQKRRTYARTRLVALSNPRSSMPVCSYTHGVDVIRELIGNPEDIRRFDAAMVVASTEVSPGDMNTLSRHRPQHEHVFTAGLCRALVLWAWTRRDEQVIFTHAAEQLILDRAGSMCDVYSDIVPLVDRGSMRNKLARLSAALAARLFATPDGERLIVGTHHVEVVSAWLDRVYSSAVMGYRDMSAALKQVNELKDPAGIRTVLLTTPFPADLIERLLHTDEIELRDISDWTSYDRESAVHLLSQLVRKNALERRGNPYRKTGAFIALLKTLLPEAKTTRPDHVKEAF
jgi:hypothetical protein